MVLKDKRKETPFATRDNMLDIWDKATELSFRGFGKKPRKMPKTPKNASQWSQKSLDKWRENEELKLQRAEQFDLMFISQETKVVDNLCRTIVYKIDAGNSFTPQYLCEWNEQRIYQNEAISACNNLKRELNHIGSVLPCNKNFIAQLCGEIDKELDLLHRWKKSTTPNRKKIIEKLIERKRKIA